ncbi:ATP-grasp domain-containing protein [Metabacillus arenae]|uniref:ATP-grasp domain-containing protein n=1 Tax=Metabacillus arenae TaxID=2771434 RepID=A0A926NIF1_9BACI|nr:ATP-grasp domain-containing protein [Metabacillus arenae]MBD1381926.1 ATP-grasp domain-containing protein [Metabacillus arenae]
MEGYNILITSISKKVPLIKAVRKASQKLGNKGKIIGADINPNCIGKFFVDSFWEMPSIHEISINELTNYCANNNIKAIVPTRDGDLPFFANYKEELLNQKINVHISDKETIEVCLDKLSFYSKLLQLNYPAIPTVKNINLLNSYYFVVKEQFGAGSKNIGIKLTKEEAVKKSLEMEKPIFQPYIEGEEYSIDVYVTERKQTKGLIVRRRVLVENGESQITSTEKNNNVEQLFSKIAEDLGLYGHVVFQAIIDQYGRVHIIECNSRFGGASTLSIAAGLDSFYWFFIESSGLNIDHYKFERCSNEKTQIRYAEDMLL